MKINREILFRAKSVATGNWVVGKLMTGDSIYKNGERITIDPNTVGQFTSFIYPNGNKIYEGDIFRWGKDNKLYVVTFFNGMFYGSVEECNKDIYGGFPLWFMLLEFTDYVGNIYDNPELIITTDEKDS